MPFYRSSLLLVWLALSLVVNAQDEQDLSPKNDLEEENGKLFLNLPTDSKEVRALLLTKDKESISFTAIRPKDCLLGEGDTIMASFSYGECSKQIDMIWRLKQFDITGGSKGELNMVGTNTDVSVLLDNAKNDGHAHLIGNDENHGLEDVYGLCKVSNEDVQGYSLPHLLNFSMHSVQGNKQKNSEQGDKQRCNLSVEFGYGYQKYVPTTTEAPTISEDVPETARVSKWLYISIGIAVLVVVIILALILCLWCFKCRKRDKKDSQPLEKGDMSTQKGTSTVQVEKVNELKEGKPKLPIVEYLPEVTAISKTPKNSKAAGAKTEEKASKKTHVGPEQVQKGLEKLLARRKASNVGIAQLDSQRQEQLSSEDSNAELERRRKVNASQYESIPIFSSDRSKEKHPSSEHSNVVGKAKVPPMPASDSVGNDKKGPLIGLPKQADSDGATLQIQEMAVDKTQTSQDGTNKTQRTQEETQKTQASTDANKGTKSNSFDAKL